MEMGSPSRSPQPSPLPSLSVGEAQSPARRATGEMAPSGENPDSHFSPLVSPSLPSFPEMGQMVCGSCRQLLSYPKHADCVQCTCCQTVNLVLEAHQVGNIKCGKCFVLLMYPYGAPAVRCSCCRFVTEIGKISLRSGN
ncbi:protein LOL5-like isoform X2 [Wolffia australiana]